MAAHDPAVRRAAASTAARARVAGLTAEQRRAMTARARDALHDMDVRAVDDWARRIGRHPLPPAEHAAKVAALGRRRALRASLAAAEALRRRRALAADLITRHRQVAL